MPIPIHMLEMIIIMDTKRITLTHIIGNIQAPLFLSGQQGRFGLIIEIHFSLLITMVSITHGIMDTVILMD